jgi:predicted RNA-binding Zn-ribbon protein involved in translation (DUF1610 family)
MFRKYLEMHHGFTTCVVCGFTYLPMSTHAIHNCPKCSPQESKVKIADVDEDSVQYDILNPDPKELTFRWAG